MPVGASAGKSFSRRLRREPCGLTVLVPVVQVGIVRVLVPHGLVPMPVRVRLGHRPVMVVLMVLVMGVAVLVLHHVVDMLVLMPPGEVQP